MPFDAIIELSDLDGSNGFQLGGLVADDHGGYSVSSAGDVNGDGIDDLIIGAPQADLNGDLSGSVYVVFGSASGFSADFDLSTLDGSNGFRIDGAATRHYAGWRVIAAGDVNGDGTDDLAYTAIGAGPNGSLSGAVFVVFGSSTGFSATLDPTALDGSNGFRINGVAANNFTGEGLRSAGDVNGDGVDDLIIGAAYANGSASGSGVSYVVFGSDAGLPAVVELSGLDGTDGFAIRGEGTYDRSGDSVSGVGDVNGDGIDDVIIGARRASVNGQFSGASYVVFGSSSGFAASLDLAGLDGTDGFRIGGPQTRAYSGSDVGSAGDVNGDGFADLLIHGTPNGFPYTQTFIVFGVSGGFTAAPDLNALNGSNGFVIHGGALVATSAGDVNGDGFDDILLASFGHPVNGMLSGSSFVVFGAAGGFMPSLNLDWLDGTNGFRINGEAAGDQSGFSIAAAGDVNGDGVDDVLIGARGLPNSTYAGGAYVVYGIQADLFRTGTAVSESISGRSANDTLSGMGGNDVLYGMGGNDTLDGGDLADLLYGGDGADDLLGGSGGDILNGDAGDDGLDGGDGADKLFGGTGSDLLTGAAGNDRMSGDADIDTLNGDAGNDYLDGGTGADIMSGGADNDIYIVDDAGDQTIELAGEGYDIVRTELSWTLADNIEALQLQGATDADGGGNAGANNLQGNAGANRLSGGAGVDTLNGADGDDIIVGGLGNDLLRGGLGADSFVVAHAFGPVLETDQIYDFSTAEGDIIDLSGAYAGALALVAGFSKHAGEMTLTFAGGITTLKLDINGDGKVDYQMKINGDVTGDSGDWLL